MTEEPFDLGDFVEVARPTGGGLDVDRIVQAVAEVTDAAHCPRAGDYHKCALLVENWWQGAAVSRADECPVLWAWRAVGVPVIDRAQGVDCYACEDSEPHRHWGHRPANTMTAITDAAQPETTGKHVEAPLVKHRWDEDAPYSPCRQKGCWCGCSDCLADEVMRRGGSG